MPEPDFAFEPPLPPQPPPAFSQRLRLREQGAPVAEAVWSAWSAREGIYQLHHVDVTERLRRTGRGSTLLAEVVRQIAQHASRSGAPARRLVAFVAQPQVVARAWLLRHGFVHIHTLETFDPEGEILVLSRTFD